jgi:hypothetical protein
VDYYKFNKQELFNVDMQVENRILIGKQSCLNISFLCLYKFVLHDLSKICRVTGGENYKARPSTKCVQNTLMVDWHRWKSKKEGYKTAA